MVALNFMALDRQRCDIANSYLAGSRIARKLRLTLIKSGMPGLAPGIFIWTTLSKGLDHSGS